MASRKFKISMTICGIAFAAVLFMFSPFFYVEEIVIDGNDTVSLSEIYERLGLDRTTNILLFNQSAARSRVMENLYVADVQFTRRVPGRLYVQVRERRLAAFIEHTPGSFLYIDDEGRVLEVRNFVSQPLPTVVGLNFTRFALGEILDVPDRTAFSIVTQYAHLIYRHGLACRVRYINVSDTANTRILVGYIEFNVGGIRDAETKVRAIVGMLDVMPDAEIARGDVDLREIRSEYIFKILT